jgi:hypothetical protein
MGKLTNYAENKILDHILKNTAFSQPSTLYLALCTADPGETATGSTITEPSGGGYARKACNSWDAASSRASANTSVVIFDSATATWGTIGWLAICDHLTTGNVLIYGEITPARRVVTGKTERFAAGDIDVSVDAGAVSDWLANGILDTLLKNTPISQPTSLYVALATAAIVDADTGASIDEHSGDGYARKNCDTWDAASGGASENTPELEFAAASGTWTTLTHFAVVDHATTGHVFYHGALDASLNIADGEYPLFAAGALDLTID